VTAQSDHPAGAEAIRIAPDSVGGGSRLESRLWLNRPRQQVFDFFAEASGLQTLTPPWLDFSILTALPIEMKQGTLIDYRLRIRGMTLRWRSEITVWEPPLRFVDEQVKGPYRHWRHEHRFEPADGGTNCLDVVHYRVPGGRLVDWLLVRRDLRRIFEFRRQTLRLLFPEAGHTPTAASDPPRPRDAAS
jgi:ligand-binding SRPBCC domain-containing protein